MVCNEKGSELPTRTEHINIEVVDEGSVLFEVSVETHNLNFQKEQ